MAESGSVIRVKLDLRSAHPRRGPHDLVWSIVDKAVTTTISQFEKLIRTKYAVPSESELYLDDALLPPDEPIQILSDKDTNQSPASTPGWPVFTPDPGLRSPAMKKRRRRRKKKPAEECVQVAESPSSPQVPLVCIPSHLAQAVLPTGKQRWFDGDTPGRAKVAALQQNTLPTPAKQPPCIVYLTAPTKSTEKECQLPLKNGQDSQAPAAASCHSAVHAPPEVVTAEAKKIQSISASIHHILVPKPGIASPADIESAKERLQKKQAALRQAIDKIIAAASDPLQSPTIQVGELEEHLDLLLEQAEELKSVNESIEKKIDLQELDAELEACAAYTEKICSLKTKLKRALRSHTANESRSTTPSVTGNTSEQEAHHIGSVSAALFQPPSATTKLPKLGIAKFSGALRSWQKFWNKFESTIHKNSTLPAIAKFQYLTSCLTGKKRERRCYKCAKKKHRAAECRTARWLKCAKCSGRHATGVFELNQRLTRPPSFEDAAPAETTVQSSLQVGPTRERPACFYKRRERMRKASTRVLW
ncbi:hypothetical protein HPB49_002669 [Dermacentor silvarum]|uniref:Uncharacterized protein n=1 Tax=Dermacentor silvarum TaxID=543639 RepID=A0ACB8DSV8_DERSI|nr:hypothetical protein HPB49_002669 [Dermacentor silvarum]